MLILPYPPSANRNSRIGNNRAYTPANVTAYKLECGWCAQAQVTAGMPFAGAVSLTLRFYRPRRSGDLDNRIKIVQDALNGIAWVDDKQICELHVYRFEDKRNPRVEAEISEVSHAE